MAWYFRLTDSEAVRHDQALDRRRLMDSNRAAAPETPTPRPSIRGTKADPRPRRADRDSVRAPQWIAVEHATPRDGVWIRYDVLAAARPLATSRRLDAPAYRPAQRITTARPNRSGTGGRRQFVAPRAARGKKTGPNPTDRRKAGSKNHVLTDAHGIPLVARLTAAHRHDVTQLLPLVDAMPPLQGRAGRPV